MLSVNVKKHFYDQREPAFSLDAAFSTGDGITILSGASGSGKTTILKLIAGILTPEEGVIELDSQIFFDASHRINLPIQKRRVGFVFQDYALFPHLDALQNIAYGVKAEKQSSKIERAAEMLALFRLDYLAKRLPRQMSGGEQQRVALARALASSPSIVLLDEPLAAVDFAARAKLLDEIETAQHQSKIPFIYVTHNEIEAVRLGNNRIVLERGRIIDDCS